MNKENYGSEFLYAESLLYKQAYQAVSVTIEEFIPTNTIKTADGKLIDKPILRFAGKNKILVLCKTNASLIHFVTGEPPGPEWVGKTITLQPRVVDAFGEQVVAIRVIPPKGCMVRKSVLKRLGKPAEWKAGA